MSLFSTVLSILGGLVTLFTKLLIFLKEKSLVRFGREQMLADLAKEEINVNREQTEILTDSRTKDDIVKKLEEQKF